MPLLEMQKGLFDSEEIDLSDQKLTIMDQIMVFKILAENKNLKRIFLSAKQLPDIPLHDLINSPNQEIIQYLYFYLLIVQCFFHPVIELHIKEEEPKNISSFQAGMIKQIFAISAKKSEFLENFSKETITKFNTAFESGETEVCLQLLPELEKQSDLFSEFVKHVLSFYHKKELDNAFSIMVTTLVLKTTASAIVNNKSFSEAVDETVNDYDIFWNKELANLDKALEPFIDKIPRIELQVGSNQKMFSTLMKDNAIQIKVLNKSILKHIIYLNENNISKRTLISFSKRLSGEDLSELINTAQSKKGTLEHIIVNLDNGKTIRFDKDRILLRKINLNEFKNYLNPKLLANIKKLILENCSETTYLDQLLMQFSQLEEFTLKQGNNQPYIFFKYATLSLQQLNLNDIKEFLRSPLLKNIIELEIVNCYIPNNQLSNVLDQFVNLRKLNFFVNESESKDSWNCREKLAELLCTLLVNNKNLRGLQLAFSNDFGLFKSADSGLHKITRKKLFSNIAQHNQLQDLDISMMPLPNSEQSLLIDMAASTCVPLTTIKLSANGQKQNALELAQRNQKLLALLAVKNKTNLQSAVREYTISQLNTKLATPLWNKKNIFLSIISLGIYAIVLTYQRSKAKEKLQQLSGEKQPLLERSQPLLDFTIANSSVTNASKNNNDFKPVIPSMTYYLQKRKNNYQPINSYQNSENEQTVTFGLN